MSGKATERERAAFYIRPERVSVRLKRGYKRKLQAAVKKRGEIISETIERWIDREQEP
jgi:hypothetical protein